MPMSVLPRLYFIFLALLALATPVHAQSVHPLTVDVQTTSDQVSIKLRGLALRVLQQSTQLQRGVGQPVTQPLELKKQPWDTTPASLHADLLVTATDERVAIQVTRGCPGTTTVTLRSQSKVVWTRTWAAEPPKLPADALSKDADGWIPLTISEVLHAPPLPRRGFAPKVLASYYGWYGRPDGAAKKWLHWDPSRADYQVANTPVLGWYDSADRHVICQQIAWARQAGVDAFAMSFWDDAWHKTVLEAVAAEADRAGFALVMYLESAPTAQALKDQLLAYQSFAAKHPSVLRVDAKPAVLLYSRVFTQLGPAGLREGLQGTRIFAIGDQMTPETLELMDGAHTYLSASWNETYRAQLVDMSRWARLQDKMLVATVNPGYDDTHVRTPSYMEHRQDGLFYASYWASAKLADWVLITSWNEWHEGSEIEPSKEWGDTYLKITRTWADWWRS